MGFRDSLNFAGSYVQRFIPANPLVAGLASIFRATLARRIEIDPLQRIFYTVVGVDPLAFTMDVGRYVDFFRWRVASAVRINRPRSEVFFLGDQRANAYDFAVPHINRNRAGVCAICEDLLGYDRSSPLFFSPATISIEICWPGAWV